MNYYINKKLSVSFELAIQKITECLKTEGFGIISEIDIHEKLKDKLGIDFRKYKILGACNPSYAYRALQFEDKIGVLLPCNVIVQEMADDMIEVAAVNPLSSMADIENADLKIIAAEIQIKLQNAINLL